MDETQFQITTQEEEEEEQGKESLLNPVVCICSVDTMVPTS